LRQYGQVTLALWTASASEAISRGNPEGRDLQQNEIWT